MAYYNQIKKRAKSLFRDIPSDNPDIIVRVTWPDKEGKVKMTGRVINAEGITNEMYQKKYKYSESKADRELSIEILNAIVLQQVYKAKPKKKRIIRKRHVDLDESSPIVKAFREFSEKKFRIRNWAQSTYDDRMTHFRLNVLPHIQHCSYDCDFSEEDLEVLRGIILDRVMHHGNFEDNGDILEARRITELHLINAKTIYESIRAEFPQLPALKNLKGEKIAKIPKEQFKVLPPHIHLAFREAVEEIVQFDPILGRAAALMDMAFRSAEAVGVTQDKIKDRDKYMYVWVTQQNRKGELTDELKSDAAYRAVVVDDWAASILRIAKKRIEELGIDEIESMMDSVVLSAKVKYLLQKCGCTKEFMQSVYVSMAELETEDNIYDTDVSAHLLRRNRATILKNICSYNKKELVLTIGHKNNISKIEKEAMFDEANLEMLATKNKRFNLGGTSCLLVEIDGECEREIIPFQECVIENTSSEVPEVVIELQGAVVGESIEIIVEGEIEQVQTISSLTKIEKKALNQDVIGVVRRANKKVKMRRLPVNSTLKFNKRPLKKL